MIASDPEVSDICGDKYLAHCFFEQHGIDSPRTWLPDECRPTCATRCSSRRARASARATSTAPATPRELAFFLEYTDAPSMVQEVCEGEEFSTDVLSDLEGRCLAAIPRSMIESKGGESIKGRSLDDAELRAFAVNVAETLGVKGPACIQCFRTPDGRHEVTDVNPRFGGAFPLPVAAGGGYPSLVLALARGERPEPRLGAYRAGVVMTRYFSHVTLQDGPDGLEPLGEPTPYRVAGDDGSDRLPARG